MPSGRPLKFIGSISLATANTRVQISATAARYNSIRVEGHEDNTVKIYAGDLTVTTDLGTPLAPGEGIEYSDEFGVDISSIWLVSGTDTQKALVFGL